MTEIYLLLSDPEYDKMKETQMIIYISKNVFSIFKNPQMLYREEQFIKFKFLVHNDAW